MTDSMVERVARAMEARRRELIAQPLARVWNELARAAIASMREPTEAMIDVLVPITKQSYLIDAYRAMINASLEEHEKDHAESGQ